MSVVFARTVGANTDRDVRRALGQLPPILVAIAQPIWGTRLRASATARSTPIRRCATAMGMLAGGVAAAVVGLQDPPASLGLLMVGAVLATGGTRYLQIVIHHYAVHNRVFDSPLANRLLGQAISTMLLTQDYDAFHVDHIKKHHPNGKLARSGDPDLETLIVLGIRPGVSRAELWRRFVTTLVSPRYHFVFLRERLASNFVTASPPRRIAAVLVWGTTIVVLAIHPSALVPFVVAYLIPVTIGYHMSGLMQFTSEHVWLTPCRADDDFRSRARRATRGRFCGDPPPSPDLRGAASLVAWVWWSLRLATVHAAARIAVLHGDLPDHDLHHIRPTDLDWPNSMLERVAMARHEPLSEVWGLWHALDQVFQTLSALEPMDPSLTPEAYNATAFASM